MLTKKQVIEIKDHLERAQNPIFFFDNDQDGLCSFLLLQRWIGRGKGVPIKSFPELNAEYFRKVHELNADYIFVLDKHTVSKEFVSEAEKINMPIVWIDHHIVDRTAIPDFINYYNPVFNKIPSDEPVTALCWQITNREEDMWIALAGCVSDRFVPEFYQRFRKQHPGLVTKSNNPADIFYKSEIGKIAKIMGFGLKDTTTNVVHMIKFLIHAKNPREVLTENKGNYFMHKRYSQINLKYERLLTKAMSLKGKNEKIIFFQYSGDLSISSDLSSEISYNFPNKLIIVVYIKGMKANISMRGKDARNILTRAIEGIDGATGGGHEEAVGGQMNAENIEIFKNNLENTLNSMN